MTLSKSRRKSQQYRLSTSSRTIYCLGLGISNNLLIIFLFNFINVHDKCMYVRLLLIDIQEILCFPASLIIKFWVFVLKHNETNKSSKDTIFYNS
jgi:hypothetical protein